MLSQKRLSVQKAPTVDEFFPPPRTRHSKRHIAKILGKF